MANDDKFGTNLASSSVIFVALLATGTYFFRREAPLVDLRPTDQSIQEQAAPQTIDARLWQDPFAAVEKSRDKSDQRELEKQCLQNPSGNSHCKPPLLGTGTLVLGVTVSGAPYQEDAEQRRRTRYAVMAGLERAGFVPKDARHIDYFLSGMAKLGVIPTRGVEERTLRQASTTKTRATTLPQQRAAIQEPFVPFEWFENASQQESPQKKSVLVLWLREDDLKGHPLQKISELKAFLKVQCQNFKIIGPWSSDILHDMVSETRMFRNVSCNDNENKKSNKLQFYAYGASAPDDQLLGDLSDHCQKVQRCLESVGILLQRTIMTDDKLAEGIGIELKLRRPKLGLIDGDDVALISEWDTFYGQTLPKAVELKFTSDGLDRDRIHEFTYLRGLDGLLPSAERKEARKEDKATTQGEKQAGATDFFKLETDSKSLERPLGQSQFDYLRRMSKDLQKTDEELRKKGRKLRVIGVLGSDVFDKLLVLRALRPEFPEALFFTTEFDEAFAIESELAYTRNLIISSSFGPKLNGEIQGEIPSFRSSYQTSAFLATLSAIGDPANKWETPEGFSAYIAGQLLAPRIFEISRSGDARALSVDAVTTSRYYDGKQKECLKDSGTCNPLLLVAEASIAVGRSAAEGKGQRNTKDSPSCRGEDPSNSGNIQPINEKLFPTIEGARRIKLAMGLAGGAIFVLALLGFRNVRKSAAIEVVLVFLGLGAAALTCAFWEPFAQVLTDCGQGEPIAMLQGVSVWPTVLLRILGIILAGYFIWRSTSSLHDNLVEISDDMQLDPSDNRSLLNKIASFFPYIVHEIAGVFRDKRSFSITHFAWNKVRSVFDFSLGSEAAHGSDQAAQSLHLNVEPAWESYVRQERFWRRFVRASLYTIVMFLFGKFVLVPMFGQPVNLVRGDLAFNWYMRTMYGDVILMHFLTFFVFDATLFCLLFVNKLRHDQTAWPPKTMEVFNGRLDLRLQSHFVHDWIDLDFVAKRTRRIGSLIYFPFVLIALLIVSRSTVFANYAPCLTILIAQGIGLCVVFGCAIMLWWAATAARDTAKQKLADGVIFARGHYANARGQEQLETLSSRVDQLKDGAFGPFAQQPLVRAVLLPLGTFGWKVLIENGMLPGL
jgi:hypothetical protein